MAKKKKSVKKMRNELLDHFIVNRDPLDDDPEVWAEEWCKAAYTLLRYQLGAEALGSLPRSVAEAINSVIDENWMMEWFHDAICVASNANRNWMMEWFHEALEEAANKRGALAETPQAVHLLYTTDAMKWAEEFIRVVRNGVEIDEGLMVGWFANAMCAAIDAERKKIAESIVGYPVTIDIGASLGA